MKSKKCIAVLLFILVLVSLNSVTFAASNWGSYSSSSSFTIYAHCQSESDPVVYGTTRIYKSNTAGQIYVNHTVTNATPSYSNLFHAVRYPTSSSSGIASGQKWVVTGQDIPIQSNAIYTRMTYGLSARGNTKYYYNYNVTRVRLSGTFRQ